MQAELKAVIWDFGGVVTSSPFDAFTRYESERGLPANTIRQINATDPDSNAWARFERAEIDAKAFDSLFAEEAARIAEADLARQPLHRLAQCPQLAQDHFALALQLVFPPEYRQPMWIVSLILTPGLIALSFSIANDTFYLVTNTLRVAMILSLIGIVVNGLVVWHLARTWPETGVAWGLSITMFWCVTHYLYAAWYFRTHRGGPSASPDGPAVSEASGTA